MEELEYNVIKLLSRHLVPISFTFQKDSDYFHTIVTTFILSVSDRWFLITAGHCIRDINDLLAKNELIACRLIDSNGLEAIHNDTIPYTYSSEKFVSLSDDYGFDYGLTELSPYYINLLQENGTVPLNEEVWKKQPKNATHYRMLGVPSEFVNVMDSDIEFLISFLIVRPLTEIPDGFTPVDAPLFYGKVILDGKVNSIKGMSGGPIFAFQQDDNGEVRYYIVAIQSRWLPESHNIAACPSTLLGNIIEMGIKMIDENLK